MRQIPATARENLQRPNAPDAVLAFLTIEHPNLVEPIRVVSDVLDYSWQDEIWIGLPFGFRLVTDDDAPPTTVLRVQNVDRKLGAALRTLPGRASCRVDVLSSADFDLTVVPRVPLGEVTPIYGLKHFELVDVTVTAIEVSGTLMLRDYSQEPWPGVSATQSRCPGLFR